MPERLGFAVVGAGTMGKRHARVYQELRDVDLVAVVDSDESRAKELAGHLGGVEWHTDYRALLEDARIAGITVATPDHLHRNPVIECLEAGKHVLVEKPLATTLEECDAILRTERESGKVLMVNYNHRWAPPYAVAKQAIQDESKGKPVMAYARKNDTIYVPTEMLSWSAGTSPASFLSSHDIDLVRWFFGREVRTVYARGIRRILKEKGIDTFDAIQAMVEFDGGAIATFESSWIYPNTYPTLTDSFIELILEKGSIHVDRKAEMVEVSDEKAYQYPTLSISCEIGGRIEGAFKYAIEHFIDCIREERQPDVSGADGRAVAEIVEAIHRSIRTNQVIHLPLT